MANQPDMTPENPRMPLTRKNYIILAIGFAVVLLGFVLMAGGGSGDPAVFDSEAIFSWRRISLAPAVVLVGFGLVGYSIFHKKRENKDK